ncbi:hypothetical protein DXG03_001366 [Asterophora parasitica]|uniref:Uncharacterized protein n=1 Tax=Asterophora parasitica TaxID=117018 RepID=A0A9P7G6T9_9AGAR|nr:hypothetical protein DXG03_001366 [Asterophora parasitica]
MAADRDVFMCVAVAHQSPGKSFEELRTDDYLRSYSTTGRPPPPCPALPIDEAQRTRLGLPPLFKPYSERTLSNIPGLRGSLAGATTRKLTPAEFPTAQVFVATKNGEGEQLQSMSAMVAFEDFSHEEIRYYAYFKGHKNSPTPITMVPFVPAPPPSNPLSSSTSRTGFDPPGTNGEQMQTITTQAAYAGHSLEELRITYIQTGLELTSTEIIARTPRPPGSAFGAVPTTPAGAGGLLSRPAGVRLF